MNDKQSIFRKKALDRISSPDKLSDYLRVTSPGVWVILVIVLLLLISLIAWSAIGTLETKTDVKVLVEDHSAQVLSINGTSISDGMPLRVSGQDVIIASTDTDEYGRTVGVAEVVLPNGIYDGVVITETMHPLMFLLESR